MRINAYVARATGLGRRKADRLIIAGKIKINGSTARLGQTVGPDDVVEAEGNRLSLPEESLLIMLNKPAGYVVSRSGQGSRTIYELLPESLHNLKPVGRLDKDSTGLLLLTNNGRLAQALAHPSAGKLKTYNVALNKPLSPADEIKIRQGVELEDGPSRLKIINLNNERKSMVIRLGEGRNRQIRRTFLKLGYKVIALHRTEFGEFKLKDLKLGGHLILTDKAQSYTIGLYDKL